MSSAQLHFADRRRSPATGMLTVALVAAAAFYFYRLCWPMIAPDLANFLLPWYGHILKVGPTAAFAQPFSDYTPSYLYLLAAASFADPLIQPVDAIKWLSVAGTGFLALGTADLVRAMGGDPRRAVLTFLLPTIALNAAFLSQCDAIWAGAAVFAVASAVRGDCVRVAVWSGVAVAFKAQAVFIAPFIVGLLWGRRAPWWCWALPALTYAAFMFPAWLMGWPAGDLATIYLRQAGEYPSPGNLANPWVIVTMFAGGTGSPLFILGYVAAIAAAIGIAVLTSRSTDRPKALILLALLSSIAIPFLLPKMHERYYFLADVLAFGIWLGSPRRREAVVALAVQIASLISISVYVYFVSSSHPALPAAASTLLAATALAALTIGAICRDAFRQCAGSNSPLPLFNRRAGA